ncbi:SPFH domain-containing protein [Streptomyces sp. NPDC098085]|uniref:SPFH domain-containing protein n=1 Tax=Streptomyces sp. NPDC098085 TaxID=3366094 RepID=UPI0038181775
MGSTVSDSSGTPDDGRERERERAGAGAGSEAGAGKKAPVRGPQRPAGHDGAADPDHEATPAPAPAPSPGGGAGTRPAPSPGNGAWSATGAGTGPAPAPRGGAGTGPGPGNGAAPAPGAGRDAGPDSVVDLVLDLVPGEDEVSALGATSASVSVPAAGTGAGPAATPGAVPAEDPEPDTAPVPALAGHRTGPGSGPSPLAALPSPHRAAPLPGPGSVGEGQSVNALRGTGRRHAVIATEQTASIPVHLLFREDAERADAAALPAGVLRRGAGGRRPAAGVPRPAAPRGPQVRPPTRPAPVGDPRLAERPGPALPGWAALLAGLAGTAAAGAVLWWVGALPATVLTRLGIGSRPYEGIGLGAWAALAALGTAVLFALGGLSRGRVGYAWVLTLFGEYRGSVRRTGLMWISPLLLRRRVDVRLRHWRSEPLPAVDANGTALRVVVLVVWRIKDTVRATLGVEDHETYLREQVEAAMARVLSQLPADAFHEDAHTLRNAEAVGDALTRMLKADCEPVGVEVYSAQPTGIEYAPEVAAAMQRRRIAAIDAKHRDSVLTSVVDAVDDTVNRLTARGLVELDDYERKSLVKDLTVAFYTGRSGGEGA